MNPLVVLAVAALVVLSTKRRNGVEGAEPWRFYAVFAGCLWPYCDVFLWLLGEGTYWQARHALFWSLPLLPVFAVVVSALLSPAVRMPFQRLLPGVMTGMFLTLLMGMLTDDYVAPLALVSDMRVGLGWLHPLDVPVVGFALLGLVMAWVFPPYNRDMARLALGCVVLAVAVSGGLAWEAGRQGKLYARALALGPVEISVRPGGGNPLHWDVMVEERNGKLHFGRMDLMPTPGYEVRTAGKSEDYQPVNAVTWKGVGRFGEGAGLGSADQRRVRLAWYDWQETPFGTYGRPAVFAGFLKPALDKAAYCVEFKDGWDPDGAMFVVCPPAREDERARIYRKRGDGVPVELAPVVMVRA